MSDPRLGALTKAYLAVEPGSTTIAFLFNPAQLTVQLGNTWAGESGNGLAAPTLSFKGGRSGVLTLKLVLDTTDTGTTVTTYTDQLAGLLAVDTSLPGYDQAAHNGRPRWVELHWGDRHFFRSVLTSLTLTFTYFDRTGTPLRANADLTLQQLAAEATLPLQNPTSHTPDVHRLHTVQAGETLDRIAAKVYGDSGKWRRIAEANRITDPLAVAPGTVLALPRPTPRPIPVPVPVPAAARA